MIIRRNPKKIILPIIYDESQWSSINWIVKSKVFPESGFPFTSLDEKSKATTITKLVNTIESAIAQKSQNTLEMIPKDEENIILSLILMMIVILQNF